MSSEQTSGRHQELLLKHLLERISRQMTRVDREVEQLRTSLAKLSQVSPLIADALDSDSTVGADELPADKAPSRQASESTDQSSMVSQSDVCTGTVLSGNGKSSTGQDSQSKHDSRLDSGSSSPAPDLPKPRPAVVRPSAPQVAQTADDDGGEGTVENNVEGSVERESLSQLPPPSHQPTEVSGDILQTQPEWATDVAEQTEKTAEIASQAAATAVAAAAGAAAAVASLSAENGPQEDSDEPAEADAEPPAGSATGATLTADADEDGDDEFDLVPDTGQSAASKVHDDGGACGSAEDDVACKTASQQPERQLVFRAARPPVPATVAANAQKVSEKPDSTVSEKPVSTESLAVGDARNGGDDASGPASDSDAQSIDTGAGDSEESSESYTELADVIASGENLSVDNESDAITVDQPDAPELPIQPKRPQARQVDTSCVENPTSHTPDMSEDTDVDVSRTSVEGQPISVRESSVENERSVEGQSNDESHSRATPQLDSEEQCIAAGQSFEPGRVPCSDSSTGDSSSQGSVSAHETVDRAVSGADVSAVADEGSQGENEEELVANDLVELPTGLDSSQSEASTTGDIDESPKSSSNNEGNAHTAADGSLPVAVHQRQVPSVRSVFDPEPDRLENLAQITAKDGALPRRRELRRQENEAAARRAESAPQVATVVAPEENSETANQLHELQVPEPRTEVFNAGTRHWTHGALHGWTEAGRQGVLSVPEGVDLKGLCLLAMCDAADEGRAVTIVVQTHREAISWEHFLRHDAASAIPATRSLPAEIELCAIGSSAVPSCADSEHGRLWIGVGMDRWTGDLSEVAQLLGQGAWVLGTLDDGENDQSRLNAIGLAKPAYRLSREEALDLRLFGSYRIALVPVPLYRTEANRYQATTNKVADTTRALAHLAGSSDPATLLRAARAWSVESTTGRQATTARAWLQARQQQMESLADVGSKLASVVPVLAVLDEPVPATVLTRWSASSVKVATDLRKAGRQAVVSREKDRGESADAWRSFAAGDSDAFVSADVPHGHLVLPKARTLLVTSGPVSTQQAVRRLSGLAQGGILAIMFAPGTVEDPAEDPYGCLSSLMNNATALRQVRPTASRKG